MVDGVDSPGADAKGMKSLGDEQPRGKPSRSELARSQRKANVYMYII